MNVMEDRDNNWQKDLQFLLGDTAILEQLAEQKSYILFQKKPSIFWMLYIRHFEKKTVVYR